MKKFEPLIAAGSCLFSLLPPPRNFCERELKSARLMSFWSKGGHFCLDNINIVLSKPVVPQGSHRYGGRK